MDPSTIQVAGMNYTPENNAMLLAILYFTVELFKGLPGIKGNRLSVRFMAAIIAIVLVAGQTFFGEAASPSITGHLMWLVLLRSMQLTFAAFGVSHVVGGNLAAGGDAIAPSQGIPGQAVTAGNGDTKTVHENALFTVEKPAPAEDAGNGAAGPVKPIEGQDEPTVEIPARPAAPAVLPAFVLPDAEDEGAALGIAVTVYGMTADEAKALQETNPAALARMAKAARIALHNGGGEPDTETPQAQPQAEGV